MAYNYEWPYVGTEVYNDDWLLKKMFELIEEWKSVKQDFATLQEAFNSLKSYVDNYFDNLDVQTEINNKLDDMYAGGELDNLFQKYLPRFPIYRRRKAVWFTDEMGMSYTSANTPASIISYAAGLNVVSYQTQSGIGYTTPTSIETLITNYDGETDTIAYVFLFGGHWDSSKDSLTIYQSVINTALKARAKFNNAQIIIISPYLPLKPDANSVLCAQSILFSASTLGYCYIDIMTCCIGQNDMFMDDYHINSKGVASVAQMAASLLLNRSTAYITPSITLASGITAQLYSCCPNDIRVDLYITSSSTKIVLEDSVLSNMPILPVTCAAPGVTVDFLNGIMTITLNSTGSYIITCRLSLSFPDIPVPAIIAY